MKRKCRTSYDAIGNPTNVFDGSLGYELEWEGRQLKSYRTYEYDIDTVLYLDTITYTYNADGIRTSKTVNGVKHEYQLDGSQIVSETWTSGGVDHLLMYLYDEMGAPVGLKYRTNAYAEGVYDSFFFDKNLQGDIVAVYNSSGEVIGTYTYDAWGVCTYSLSGSQTTLESSIVLNYNPFRYRGYFYDRETKLYYLQTRYYNPSWCRFINADNILSTEDLLGLNLFAYCGNNPVNRTDPTGEAWWHWAIGAAVVAACAVATVVTCGGFAAAAGAVAAVSSGVAASTAAATITASAFVASATVYSAAVITEAGTSDSVEEFYEKGDWGTVGVVVASALYGGYNGYTTTKTQAPSNPTSSGTSTNTATIKYPGNDPTKCDVPGFEWRGSGSPASGHGNFVNMKTGEWLHPDLNHGPPIGPHWDYGIRGSSQTFRIFPDGRMSPK